MRWETLNMVFIKRNQIFATLLGLFEDVKSHMENPVKMVYLGFQKAFDGFLTKDSCKN